MKLWRLLKLRILLLAVVSFNAQCLTGVAFVHGKGAPHLSQLSFAWGYWSVPTIKTLTLNFKVPFCLAHYDGTLPIQKAANVVTNQLLECAKRKNIDDFVIETHSYGGVVMRWVFSNPEEKNFSQLIKITRWINTLAAPQLGSEAADMASALNKIPILRELMCWTGENNPATRELKTANMAYLNAHFMWGTPGRPKTAKIFYSIAGTGVLNDWYNLHLEDYLLKIVDLVVPFRRSHDGVVTVRSAEGAGIQWFRTTANHFHIKRGDYDPEILKSLTADVLEASP